MVPKFVNCYAISENGSTAMAVEEESPEIPAFFGNHFDGETLATAKQVWTLLVYLK